MEEETSIPKKIRLGAGPAREIREGKMPIKGEEAATNGRLKNIRKKA